MNTITDNLTPYRKHSAIAFQVLPGRNRLHGLMPYVKLTVAFGLGVLAMAMLLVVAP